MADFEVARSTSIAAPAERIHGLIDDFHAWRSWSPWEDVDRALRREYSGPESGVGLVGKDFERGLTRMKAAAESG